MPFQIDIKPFQSDTAQPFQPDIEPSPVAVETPQFGNRVDGTPKGLGFFGPLQRPDGDISTELSIGVGFDGKETEIPLLVPTLDQQEIDSLLGGNEATQQITNKAVSHARQRIGQGLSPFAQEGEQVIPQANIESLPELDFAPQIADPSDIEPSTPADPTPQISAAPERTLPQKIGDFFIGKPEQRPFLPSDAGRAEKFDHTLKAVASMPVRAFVKFGKGLLLGTPDLAFAAIKKITPDDLWVDGVENMSLDQAIDWAMGYDPSGFSKLVSDVAEFSGGIKAVGGIVGKGVPKSATVVDKALRNASVFALARTGRELSKFGAELIDPETDYQYVGAAGVIADFGIGLGLSLLNSASRPVLATVAKSPVGRAISDAGHRVVIAFTKRFPVLADKIRANPNKFFTDLILQSAKNSGINIDDLSPQQTAVLSHVAREAERRYVKAVGNFVTPDVVTRRPRQLAERPVQPVKPVTPTKPTPKAIKPVAKPVEAVEGEVVTPKDITVEKMKTEMVRVPTEDVSLFEELRNNTEDFNKKRVSKARKAEIIARTKEIKRDLGRKGYSAEVIRGVEMADTGIPFPPAQPTPTAKAETVRPPTKQIEVSDSEAAALLGESLEKIKANVSLKEKLSKELIITEFQPSDFVPKTKKGPGLTRAEQQIITPKVQGELRFAQTQGLPVGFRAGQKEANDIAKRRLDDFRTAKKVEKVALQDARKLVTEYAKDPVVAKKLITSLAKVDSPAKMAAFADKIGEFVREAERKQAITSYKTTFNQLKKDNRLGKVAFGKLRPAARERILRFADTIDLKKLSVAKREELETLMGKVKDLGVDLSEGVRQLDVDTRDALNQLDPLIDSLDRLSKTAVSDMGLEEIRIAEDTLKFIIRQNEIENKQIFGKRLVESRETETKAITEVSVSKKQKKIFKKEAKKGIVAKAKRPGIFATLKRGTVGQSRTVPTLVQVSTVKGATAAKKVLDTEIWDGFRKSNETLFESVDFLEKQYAKHNITTKTYDSFDKEFKVVIGGKSRIVTADDLGGIEMHLRSLENLEQLRKTEGIWVQGKLVTGFTIKELVNAAEKLTPSQLKMLDIYNLQNRIVTAPAINEEFLNLWGYEPATNPNYWAIVRRFKKRVGGFLGINFSKAIEQQSSFQPRTGGTKPIVIVPFRQQMWHSIQVGARSRTAIAFHNARTLLNSDKWQNKMIDAGRENEMSDIIKIFERTQGLSSDKDVLEMAGQTLLSNLAKSKLSLRVTTPLVQVASFPVSFSEINNKYAVPLKGHRSQTGKAQLKRLKKFSPTIRLRFEGGRITPEVGNISASEGFKMLVFGKVGVTSKPLVPLRAFDRATILAIDIMVQRQIKDTTNLKGDEFWNAISLETERVVRLTQPMWDHFARSVLLTNPNFFLRATIPFRAPREAMLNVLVRGNDSLGKGDKKKWAKSAGAVAGSLVMARLIKLGVTALSTTLLGLFIKGRIPKRRKDLSDFATDLTNDAISLAPFIGDIIAPTIEFAIEGKTFREGGFNNLLGDFAKTAGIVTFDATKAAIQFADGDTKKAGESFQKALVGTLQTAAEFKGLPFTGPRDIIRPALKAEPAGTFGRTQKTRTQPTRTKQVRTKPTRTFGRTR